ncbi:MAG: TIGR00159 family protein [Bacteroidetes bacterium CG12_big_fil_rev_8_21_14_0_65_60_17]|nr:MAG: TIGR00159 family protein [Bacteroidetes bacterium CG12_big_fil_rev_8_21_14_0_65_60_17]
MTLIDWVIPVRLVDLLEIGLVAYVLYMLYQLMRGTIAVQIGLGILALYVVQLLVTAADMTILQALFGSIAEVFVLAVIILFQPEIRRVLLLLGQNPLVRRFMRSPAKAERVHEIACAVRSMSEQRIGALIVFERSSGLRSYIETGAVLQAQISQDLLITIFYAQNPLHDGAVIIRDGRIEAARCILPISTNMRLSSQLGLRHRAAVGVTEISDAVVIVVSEETGRISVARDGELKQNILPDIVEKYVTEALSPTPDAP